MLPDDLEGDREAEARAVLLRREVGLEDLGQVLLGDAHAACPRRRSCTSSSTRSAARRELAAAGHGGERVLHEVEHGLLHEPLVEGDPRQALLDVELDHDARALGLGLDELGDARDELARVGLAELDVHGPDGEEEVDDDLVEPVDLLVHDAEVALEEGDLDLLLALQGLADELDVDREGAQGILDLVGDARGEGGERGEALGPAQLGLLAPLLGDVLHVDDGALDAALRDEGAHRDRDEPGARPWSRGRTRGRARSPRLRASRGRTRRGPRPRRECQSGRSAGSAPAKRSMRSADLL